MSADPPPLLVLSCDACATAYQATGEQATTLRAMPAYTSPRAGMHVTREERAQYLAQAGVYAHAAGWEMVPSTGMWRCPRCREQWGEGAPRRYTLREVAELHNT